MRFSDNDAFVFHTFCAVPSPHCSLSAVCHTFFCIYKMPHFTGCTTLFLEYSGYMYVSILCSEHSGMVIASTGSQNTMQPNEENFKF